MNRILARGFRYSEAPPSFRIVEHVLNNPDYHNILRRYHIAASHCRNVRWAWSERIGGCKSGPVLSAFLVCSCAVIGYLRSRLAHEIPALSRAATVGAPRVGISVNLAQLSQLRGYLAGKGFIFSKAISEVYTTF